MSVHCSMCGLEMPEKALFCPNCGSKKSETQSPATVIDDSALARMGFESVNIAKVQGIDYAGSDNDDASKKKKDLDSKNNSRKYIYAGITLFLFIAGIVGLQQQRLKPIAEQMSSEQLSAEQISNEEFKLPLAQTSNEFTQIESYSEAPQGAEQKYSEGLKILIADTSPGFAQSENYFRAYLVDFPNSSRKDQVNSLIGLIDKYKEKRAALDQNLELKKSTQAHIGILDTLDRYIMDAKRIHALANRAINENDAEAGKQLVVLISSNLQYYQSLTDDINSVNAKDMGIVFFTEQEYRNIDTFIRSGIFPGITYTYLINNGTAPEEWITTTRNSWSVYSNLISEVDRVMARQRGIVAYIQAERTQLEQECESLSRQIRNFNGTVSNNQAQI